MEKMTEAKTNKDRWGDIFKKLPVIGEWLEPSDKVAVIRMAGVIADSSMMRRAGINFQKFRDSIADAFELKRVKAVALAINSPGGAPAQCSVISAMIKRLSEEKDVPVFAFVEDVAASGGYWLACLGQEIYAQETSIVGSIGVISSGFGFDQLIKEYKVERRIHTSGRDKSFMDPFRAEKADDVARLKSLQADMHETFKDWVIESRGGRLRGSETELMEGAFWTGKQALENGLIDGIGDVGGVMKQKYGDDIKFIDCSPEKKSMIERFLPFVGDSKLDLGSLVDAAEEKAVWNRYGL